MVPLTLEVAGTAMCQGQREVQIHEHVVQALGASHTQRGFQMLRGTVVCLAGGVRATDLESGSRLPLPVRHDPIHVRRTRQTVQPDMEPTARHFGTPEREQRARRRTQVSDRVQNRDRAPQVCAHAT